MKRDIKTLRVLYKMAPSPMSPEQEQRRVSAIARLHLDSQGVFAGQDRSRDGRMNLTWYFNRNDRASNPSLVQRLVALLQGELRAAGLSGVIVEAGESQFSTYHSVITVRTPTPEIAYHSTQHCRAWNDGAVIKIARQIFNSREIQNAPLLADALEEAGCEDADLLSALRSHGQNERVRRLVRQIAGYWY